MENNKKTKARKQQKLVAKNRMHFFKSFDEEAEFEYRHLASLSPLEHLANATELIKRVYKKELKKNPGLGNRIYFS